MFKNFDITNCLIIIATVGYILTGILAIRDSKAHSAKFHDLTEKAFLAIIAFGKVENRAENEKDREKDKDMSKTLPPRPK